MQIKPGFAMRKIAGSNIVVPVGAASSDFNGMITLNDTGAFLWNCFLQPTTEAQVVLFSKGCGFPAGKRAGIMRCGLAPRRCIFNTTPSHREGVLFCKKMSKTGKKGRFIDIDSVFVYCYKYRC